jgi:glycosyltransferase involved in cell wall biosynthesis
MKVVFITREGRSLSGARVRCYNFARALAARGADTEVFSYAEHLGAPCGENERRMSMRDKLRMNMRAYARLRKERRGTVFFVQRFNYHSFAPWLSSLTGGFPLIFDCDDWDMREDPAYHFGFYPSSKAEFLTHRLAGGAAACVAASRFLESYLRRFNRNVLYVPTGVDTADFSPGDSRPSSGEIVFSWAGTVYHRPMLENLFFALDCFAEAAKGRPDMRFEVAGEGSYLEEFRDRARKMGLLGSRVRLVGWIEPGKMPEYLRSVDVGLLPLVQDTKFNQAKSPTKLFEYMAAGKPVVASTRGEAGGIIRDGADGFLAGSAAEFAGKMKLAAQDRDLRLSVGAAARLRAESEFSLEKLAARLEGFIRASIRS